MHQERLNARQEGEIVAPGRIVRVREPLGEAKATPRHLRSTPFYTAADLDPANAILTVPLSALQTAAGLQLNVSTPFVFSVLALDNYFTGNLTDDIGPMAYELDMPQFYAVDEFSVPAGSSVPVTIFPNNAATPYFGAPYNGMSPSQTRLLLIYTDGKIAREVDSITVTP